jgi:TatD DNase family protein
MTKPNLIDSHCHLHSIDLEALNLSLDQLLEEARTAGVSRMLCVCIELEDIPTLYKIADTYSDIYISAGVHPNASAEPEPDVDKLIELSNHPSCIAIGETGLDYFRTEDEENKVLQRQRFRTHIQASKNTSKPLIIHTRAAVDDTIRLLKEEGASEIGGVMHCFTESWDMAKDALDLGFYISLSGIVTFKNATQVQEVAKKVPLDRLLIETDSPYLAPIPFRGKQNHPALVRYVAKYISELRGESEELIAKQTANNFYSCFKIPHSLR